MIKVSKILLSGLLMSVASVAMAAVTYTYTFGQDSNPKALSGLETLNNKTITFQIDAKDKRLPWSTDRQVMMKREKYIKHNSTDGNRKFVYESTGLLTIEGNPKQWIYGTTSYRVEKPNGYHIAYGILRIYDKADRNKEKPVDTIQYTLQRNVTA